MAKESPENQQTPERETAKSQELHEEALRVFPGGYSHNVRYSGADYPLYLERSEGPYIWDADGNRYVDFWMNHTASILGHAYPHVVEAVTEQVRQDLHYGAPNESALRLAEKILEFVPSAERFRYAASGTEATMYAVRLARAATGREYILKTEGGWHGGNTDLAHAITPPFDAPETAGLPPGVGDHVVAFPFNDRAATEQVLDEYVGQIAAVIVEPIPGATGIPADIDFLQFLRDVSKDHGFALIFDEVITGFRFAPGSYQARVGIEPDLTTLGKVPGGGAPFGGIAGKASYFENARPDIAVPDDEQVLAGGGTFSMNPLTATAGLATIEVIESEPVYDHIEALGGRIRADLAAIFENHDVDAVVCGEGSCFYPHFNPTTDLTSIGDVKATTDRDALVEFHSRLFDHGFYFLPGHIGVVSYQTTEQHARDFLQAVREITPEFTRNEAE